MKKFLSGILAAALCLGLSACGGKETAPFDPAADAETLLASGAFSEELTQIDRAVICAQYGLDETTVTGCAAYAPTGATAEELAIFTFSSSDQADKALTALQNRVADRTDELEGYLPDEISKLDSAVVEVRGSSALLVVASDYGPVTTFLED